MSASEFLLNFAARRLADEAAGGDAREGAAAVATKVSQAVLTDDIINSVALVLGLVIACVGREQPTLIGGNLMVALFVGTVVHSAQSESLETEHWPWWPIVAAAGTFVGICAVLWCLRDTVLSALTGLASAVAGIGVILSLGIYMPVELRDDWSMPIGVPVGVALFVIGFAVGMCLARRPRKRVALAALLSAVTGVFLAESGAFWFLHNRNLATEFAEALVEASRSREEAKSAAEEVRMPVVAWLGLSIVVLIVRGALLSCRDQCCGSEARKAERHEAEDATV